MDGGGAITVRVIEGAADLSAADWDACAGDENPFVAHGFLRALEQSNSAVPREGWLPRHLVAEDAAGKPAGIMPLYVKSHSYGEYVFDHGWAQALERAGGRYYPKLLGGVPFSPVPGPRLLVRPDQDAAVIETALAQAAIQLAEQHGLSSIHVNFLPLVQAERLEQNGFLLRMGQQFHWHNDGYGSFEDFLGALSSRKRKDIRKERAAVAEAGLTMRALTGAEIGKAQWDAFYRFYRNTTDRKWGDAYLTRDFFTKLGQNLGDKVVLIVAEEPDGTVVAGALNLRGKQTLYGRNWGCTEHYKFLHFEACYYQAIDYAIAHGLAAVEAGAQGQHKIRRGYLPVATWSAHWIADRRFRNAVADFLIRERMGVEEDMKALAELSPFRKPGEG